MAEADSRRRRIIDATLDVIRDHGLAGTRTLEIARRAGVSTGLVLYHFSTLDGLVAAAMEESEDRYYRSLDDNGADRPAPERLRLLVERSGDPVTGIPAWTLWMEFWVRAMRDPATAALCAGLEARWRATLREVIDQGVREGCFTTAAPADAVLRLSALLDGLSVSATLGDRDVPVETIPRLWLEAAVRELGCAPALLGL
ncbi:MULTISPECIES: TetR/AcrR family transcriptional regulator [unclassified Nocardioides]|uniref:TetR/AcrR family transcriptional regulator n=1 Tax=unclassified Nocardioides TaxID=2615069 RepID=UPI00114F6717|nr:MULTISPECIES: TetR/AcrR family transcriptional regulator [unclassified Nocardioides]TQK71914.1 TetR family transcriptional regulator [Nocardioides sp. SLBN-35]WGY03890.1 TetR/AcrR family transcriptional regulator [Nocardioides sp. QY071]